MKRYAFSIPLLLLAVTFAATSCIDDNYDLRDLDTEVTILPGLSVPVNSTTAIPLEDILPTDGLLIDLDEDNNYQMKFKPFGSETTSISKKDFEAKSKVEIDCSFSMLMADMPFDVENLSLIVSSPISFDITNPTSEDLVLSADVYKGSGLAAKIGGVIVPPGTSTVKISDASVAALFRPFNQDVFVDNIVLSRMQPKSQSTDAPVVNAAGDETYTFDVSAYLPMEFKAGEGIEFHYSSDIFEDSGITEVLEDYDMDIKTMEIKAVITNEFPVDITLSTELIGGNAKISIDKTIAAGTVENPVATEVVISASDLKYIEEIEHITLDVYAIVPESFTSSVTLSGDQKITIDIADVTVSDGFTIEL